MTIQRRYEPDPAALERLMEILYRLLIEPGGSPEKPSKSTTSPSCIPKTEEG